MFSKYKNPIQEKVPEKKAEVVVFKKLPEPEVHLSYSQERLQEYIVWSEILGEPVCRRRKRR